MAAQIHLVVGLLVTLVLVTAGGSLMLGQRTENALSHLNETVRPAQATASELGRSYTEQTNSVLGFLLTGDQSFLQSDATAQTQTAGLQATLRQQLAGDPASIQLVAEINDAANTWSQNFATPAISSVLAGTQGPAQRSTGIPGRQTLEQRTARLTDLENRIQQIAAEQTSEVASTRALTDALTAATCLAAVALAAGTILFVRRSLTGPLTRLVGEVSEVADGALDRPVHAYGPHELASTASAVERMRVRILEQTDTASKAKQQLARYEEGERIAHGLHDQVIQRLVGIGMLLQSTAIRYPPVASKLSETIGDLDRTIRELRTVIFGLSGPDSASSTRGQVLDVVRDSERTLGFSPHVRFDGVIDPLVTDAMAAELLPTLRECLSNIARHAHASSADVSVAATGDQLVLEVTDNGVGFDSDRIIPGEGLSNLHRRAERLGGTCTLGPAKPHGTVIDWRIPVPATAYQPEVHS